MSALSSIPDTLSDGPTAVLARVQALESMISQAQAGPAAFAVATGGSFAQTLANATGGAAAPASDGSAATAPLTASSDAGATVTPAGIGSDDPAATAASLSSPASAATTAGLSTPASLSALVPATASTVPAAATGATATTAAAPAEGSTAYDGLIAQAAATYGLNPALLHGLIEQESGYNPSAVSSAGAEGLTQLMPGTAQSLGVSDPFDPTQAIDGGAKLLREDLDEFGGNVQDALAAYNAGPGAVSEYGGVPPYAQTQAYVPDVLANAQAWANSVGADSSLAAIGATTPHASPATVGAAAASPASAVSGLTADTTAPADITATPATTTADATTAANAQSAEQTALAAEQAADQSLINEGDVN